MMVNPGGYRQPQLGHLSQVRALTTQQILLVLVALGEVEHKLGNQVLLGAGSAAV